MTMRIASWNVNSLKVRLPHVQQWLVDAAPDVLGLQETKLEDHQFPEEALAALGYVCVYAGQKNLQRCCTSGAHGAGERANRDPGV